MTTTDIIGGFPTASDNCAGCGKPLLLGNAWMTDGCPCNSPLGVNSLNETRWRLLMQLQQEQAKRIASIVSTVQRLQPDGVPPVGGPEVLVDWIVREVARGQVTPPKIGRE